MAEDNNANQALGGEGETPSPPREPGRRRRRQVSQAPRRCVECLAIVPPPRRKVCSDFCAERRELKLQAYRRKHAGE